MNLRAEVTKLLLKRIAPQVDVKVILPDGKTLGPNKPNLPTLRILNDDFFNRLGNDLKIGLGESFMENDWVADPDVADFAKQREFTKQVNRTTNEVVELSTVAFKEVAEKAAKAVKL